MTSGWTAIMYASTNELFDVMNVLIENKANLNIRNEVNNNYNVIMFIIINLNYIFK